MDLSARLGHWISGQQTTTLSQETYTQLWDCVYHVSLVTVSRLQCDGLRYFPMFRSNFNVFDLSVVQKLPLFYIKMMSINRGVARIFQRGGGGSQKLLTAVLPRVSASSVVLSRHEGPY